MGVASVGEARRGPVLLPLRTRGIRTRSAAGRRARLSAGRARACSRAARPWARGTSPRRCPLHGGGGRGWGGVGIEGRGVPTPPLPLTSPPRLRWQLTPRDVPRALRGPVEALERPAVAPRPRPRVARRVRVARRAAGSGGVGPWERGAPAPPVAPASRGRAGEAVRVLGRAHGVDDVRVVAERLASVCAEASLRATLRADGTREVGRVAVREVGVVQPRGDGEGQVACRAVVVVL